MPAPIPVPDDATYNAPPQPIEDDVIKDLLARVSALEKIAFGT